MVSLRKGELRLQLASLLIIIGRIRKLTSCNREAWPLTLSCCKKEFTVTMLYLACSMMVTILVITSNFMFDVNQYQLPFRVYFELFSFAGSFINWFLNYLFQFTVTLLIAPFYFSYFALTLNIINNSCWEADVTILLVHQLDRTLNDEDSREAARILRKVLVEKKLKRIVEMTNRLFDYHDRVQSLMQLNFLVDFTMFSFLLCVILFTLKTSFFSVLLLPTMLTQLFIYCWMGNRVIDRYEALATSLYDLKWYLMDVKQQKDFHLILLRTQAMEGFNGVFKTVSFETFKEV